MNIPITPEAIFRLQSLQQEEKFSEETYYPGAPTAEIRLSCERRVNEFLGDVIALLQSGTQSDALFGRAKVLIETFEEEDTEEREKVDDYIGETMLIVGIEDWTEHV
jgi:hypothetical protein